MAQQTNFNDLFWKEALESARQGVWDYDIVTGFKHHSDTWREMRGLKPGYIHRETDDEWILSVHPDDRALASEQTARLNAGELSEVNYEYRERHVGIGSGSCAGDGLSPGTNAASPCGFWARTPTLPG